MHKESLFENKQENNFTVRKINTDLEKKVKRGSSLENEHDNQSNSFLNNSKVKSNTNSDSNTSKFSSNFSQTLGRTAEIVQGNQNFNSLQRKKQLKSASLGNLIENNGSTFKKSFPCSSVNPVNENNNNNNCVKKSNLDTSSQTNYLPEVKVVLAKKISS